VQLQLAHGKNKMKLTQAKFRELILEELAPAVDAYMRHHYGVSRTPVIRLPQKDLKRIKPEISTTERPPPLPIEALAQRKDVIVLPKSTAKLKKILDILVGDAVDYASEQNPEFSDEIMAGSAALRDKTSSKIRSMTGMPDLDPAFSGAEGDLSTFWRFRDSLAVGLLKGLRNLNVEQYLQENINDFIYIKESTCKQILSDVINRRGTLIWN
jgi:hypothetical protein